MGLNGQHSKNTGCGTTNRQPNRPLQGDRSKVVAERVTSTDAAEQNCTTWHLGLNPTEARTGWRRRHKAKTCPCHPAVAMEKQKMGLLRKNCPHCRGKLETGQRIHPACIDGYVEAQAARRERAEAKAARAAAKVERAETRRMKEAIKTRAQWLAECQAIANKYARIRDARDGCISCDKPASWDGQWHGSHFRSVGAASAVRLNLWNIHKSCSICNHHLSGNIGAYKPRLIEKIGAARVAWLEAQNQLVRYDVDYLKKYKRVVGKRLRRMEKQLTKGAP